jgi:nitroreductase
MSQFTENAQWRYATKKYDSYKKVSSQDLETLKQAISLSATSFGLEPYKVLVVQNPEIRTQLIEASWGQTIVAEASHLFVFAAMNNPDEKIIDEHFDNLIKVREIPMESIQGYKDFMKNSINNIPLEAKGIWTSKQTYLALGNLLNACADLKIDATPMEGFIKEKYDEILELKQLGLTASVICPIGYRHTDDATQHYKKVRKPFEKLFINL